MVEADNRTLGDYFTLQRGTTYKGSLLGKPGPVLLGLATIERNGGFRSDSLRSYGGDSPERLLVCAGELYLSLKDVTQSADLLGAVARLPPEHAPGRLTQDTVRLDPKSADAPLDYLYWLLRTPQYRGYCRSHATGTTNLGLAREDFLAFPAPAPTVEQGWIVEALSALDDKIKLNRRRNQTLEAMARALFKDWFVDFGPVRARMAGRDPYPPAELWQCFPDRLDDKGKPEGWEMVPLHALASLETSSISPGKSPDAVFEHYSIPAFDAGRMPAMELGDSIKSNKYKVHANAVLVSKLNPQTPRVWLPTVATDHAVCSTEFMQFVPRRPDNRPFLYCLMVSEVMEEEVLKHVTGSTGSRQRAQPSQIAKVEVLLPKPDILSAFNRQAAPLLRAIADNQRESRTLAQLRDTLLPKLTSGELRIANAERVLETRS